MTILNDIIAPVFRRTIDGRMASDRYVDVREFGAACNGNAENNTGTDDTTAVRAAVEACQNTGRELFFPGICKVTDEIVCSGSIKICGRPGMGGIRQATDGARCLVIAPTENFLVHTLSDLVLAGGRITLDWSDENGGSGTHGVLSTMRRLHLGPNGGENDGSCGLRLGMSFIGSRHSQIFINGSFNYGILATDDVVDVLGCTTWDTINIAGGSINCIRTLGGGAPATLWRNCILQGSAGSAFHSRNGDHTFLCCHFEGNGVLRDEADLELYSVIDGATAPAVARLIGCYFSSRGAAQNVGSKKRIEFLTTHCRAYLRDTDLGGDNVLETNGLTTGCEVVLDGGNHPTFSPDVDGLALTLARAWSVTTGTVQADLFTVPGTITATGTTGNQTIHRRSGTVNIAAGQSAVTVTNNLVTANSQIFTTLRTNDAGTRIESVVASSGSFIIRLNQNAGTEVSIGWHVMEIAS